MPVILCVCFAHEKVSARGGGSGRGEGNINVVYRENHPAAPAGRRSGDSMLHTVDSCDDKLVRDMCCHRLGGKGEVAYLALLPGVPKVDSIWLSSPLIE